MRFLLKSDARRFLPLKLTAKRMKAGAGSVRVSKNTRNAENETLNANHNLTKSWGQQCSPNCGCVLRFETNIDERQQITDCNYVAKSVVTSFNGDRLIPMLSTRMGRPMLQECKCKTLHKLANSVTSYLSNKRWDHVQGMNEFTFTRSSAAFRHAVLAEHDLSRSDTHCFDVVEEAFSGMIKGIIPKKRRFDSPFGKHLAAEILQRPVVVQQTSNTQNQTIKNVRPSDHQGLGVDRNSVFLSTHKTIANLGMFDIDSETWSNEGECDREDIGIDPKNDQFDWVSYVDELNMIDDSA